MMTNQYLVNMPGSTRVKWNAWIRRCKHVNICRMLGQCERTGSSFDWLTDMKAWACVYMQYVCVLLLLHLQGSAPGRGDLCLWQSTRGLHLVPCPAGLPATDRSRTLQHSQRTENLDQLQPSLLDSAPIKQKDNSLDWNVILFMRSWCSEDES